MPTTSTGQVLANQPPQSQPPQLHIQGQQGQGQYRPPQPQHNQHQQQQQQAVANDGIPTLQVNPRPPGAQPRFGPMASPQQQRPGFHPTGASPRPAGMRAPNGTPRPPTPTSSPSSKPTDGSGAITTPAAAAAATAAKSAEAYKPKLIPGKLVVCKNCGCMGQDFNLCVRCKKKIPEDCKKVDDPSYKEEKEEAGGKLRDVRIATKRKKKATDEPVCIALSSDEDEDDDGDEEGAKGDATDGKGKSIHLASRRGS